MRSAPSHPKQQTQRPVCVSVYKDIPCSATHTTILLSNPPVPRDTRARLVLPETTSFLTPRRCAGGMPLSTAERAGLEEDPIPQEHVLANRNGTLPHDCPPYTQPSRAWPAQHPKQFVDYPSSKMHMSCVCRLCLPLITPLHDCVRSWLKA